MGMIEHDFCLCRPLLFAANEIPLRPLKTLLCVITVEILLIDVGAHSRMGQLDRSFILFSAFLCGWMDLISTLPSQDKKHV